jgi:hypothetical protein
MDTTPAPTPTSKSERISFKDFSRNLDDIEVESDAESGGDLQTIDHLNITETPVRIPIHFYRGSGYAGTLPSSTTTLSWPGPRGGSFFWLSSDDVGDADSTDNNEYNGIKLNRLEIQISKSREEDTTAHYSCRAFRVDRQIPVIKFFQKLLSDPRRSLVHPRQMRRESNLRLFPSFPFGPLGGRDARPVVWNSVRGAVCEFDPKTLKSKGEHAVLDGEKGCEIGSEPVYDESTGRYLFLQRSGWTFRGKYAQYRLLVLLPSLPRLLTFMAPKSLSLDLLAVENCWCVCSAQMSSDVGRKSRRFFHVLNRPEGRLVAVYQSEASSTMHPKKFVSLRSCNNSLELIVLMVDGTVRKYFFPALSVQIARFDGAAGLLKDFPVAEFEGIGDDNNYDQVEAQRAGFIGRMGSMIVALNDRFEVVASHSLAPQLSADFSLFPLAATSSKTPTSVISVLSTDPYTNRQQLNLIDASDLCPIAKIHLGEARKRPLSPLIFLPTK